MDAGAETPKRIWIVGPCGSGKSTLAQSLGKRLDLPVHHLDDIHWNPGWIESDPESERRRVDEMTLRDAWIIDGNYGIHRRRHAARVQLFIWLDLPLSRSFPRLIGRTVRRAVSRELVCNGNRERPLETLFGADSILWWGLKTHNRRRVELERDLRDRPCLRFRSPRAVAAWVQTL